MFKLQYEKKLTELWYEKGILNLLIFELNISAMNVFNFFF